MKLFNRELTIEQKCENIFKRLLDKYPGSAPYISATYNINQGKLTFTATIYKKGTVEEIIGQFEAQSLVSRSYTYFMSL